MKTLKKTYFKVVRHEGVTTWPSLTKSYDVPLSPTKRFVSWDSKYVPGSCRAVGLLKKSK